jgi:hypothetical protein
MIIDAKISKRARGSLFFSAFLNHQFCGNGATQDCPANGARSVRFDRQTTSIDLSSSKRKPIPAERARSVRFARQSKSMDVTKSKHLAFSSGELRNYS